MKVEQIYTGCLAHGAYYILSENEVAIIDPLRESTPYLERAQKDNAQIKYIFETHFHADFVSGHLDLARKTNAKIIYGPTAKPQFEAIIATDGQIFELGKVKIKVLHTPGHTMESSCFLLIDENGKEHSIFTGDTLFIGDVGRPDLAQKVVEELTQEKLAAHLYHSIHQILMKLPDDIILYPGHGAGSACGKKMSKETISTLGEQKKNNYAMRKGMTEEEFKKEILDGLMPPPQYFPANVLMNIQGYESLDNVLTKGTKPLNTTEFEVIANETHALIIDTRDAQTFAKGFIPNAVNIGIDGSFANWVGTLVADIKQPILLVCENGREEEVVTRLARVGYDNTLGYLKGGFQAWKNENKPFDTIQSVSVEELATIYHEENINILDVRKSSEYMSQHLVNAENAPLDYINSSMHKVNKDKTYYVHCAAGYRSMIFISILKARGYENLIDIKGGFNALKQNKTFQITEYVCPTTML
jgi:glyoxylase-like metal-dependent hydrolase (beta-lactamase superfamily II)/rhodanese-related sulfurtransferase